MRKEEAQKLVTDFLAGEITADEKRQLQQYMNDHPEFARQVKQDKHFWDDMLGELENNRKNEISTEPQPMSDELKNALRHTSRSSRTATEQNRQDTKRKRTDVPSPEEEYDRDTSTRPGDKTGERKWGRDSMIAAAAAVFLVAYGLFLFFSSSTPPEREEPNWIGEVKSFTRGVQIERDGNTISVDASTKIQAHDRLIVSDTGNVTISYRNENSSFEFKRGSRAEFWTEKEAESYIRMDTGTLVGSVDSRTEERKFTLLTPHARVEIVGTKFTLTSGNQTRLEVTEGTVRFSSEDTGEETLVTSGEFAEVGMNIPLKHGSIPKKEEIAKTYYISPEGNDDHSGTSPEEPWKTFDRALPALKKGDTLVLKNGIYTPGTTGRLVAEGDSVASGTEEKPITVRAQNERKAWIRGEGDNGIHLKNRTWWVLKGLRASSGDDPEGTGGTPLKISNSSDIKLFRMLAHNNNRYLKSGGFVVEGSKRVLVEESELYYFHRNGFVAYKSSDITFRRCYANSRGYSDIEEGKASNNTDGGDPAFDSFYSSDVIIENCISENGNQGFYVTSGKKTVGGKASGDNIQLLGIVSLKDDRPGALQSRDMNESSRPLRNLHIKNFVMIGHRNQGFYSRACRSLTMENVTCINGKNRAAFTANFNRNRIWPAIEEIGGGTYRLKHWLVINTKQLVRRLPDNSDALDFLFTMGNVYNTPIGKEEDLDDDRGQFQNTRTMDPSGVGQKSGEAMVWIPEDSNMSGVGINGADIGANILYRYQDGELTEEPLWNPETGEFPHGAVVQGINDVAGNSLFDLHKRLNVNHNGTTLPYSRKGK